jgi:hypothetical protein
MEFDVKVAEIVANTDVGKEEAMDQMVSWALGVIAVDPSRLASAAHAARRPRWAPPSSALRPVRRPSGPW